MVKFLLIALLFVSQTAFGAIEYYFKPAPNKTDASKMRNIDFIYVINLDQRPEKFANCIDALTPYGIFPYRFSAVNGWEISLDSLNHLGVKYKKNMRKNLMGTCYLPENNGQPQHEIMQVEGRNYFCHCMSRGAVGIVLSHLSILQDAYDSGYNTIWIMEDDIQIIQDPHLISDRIDQLNAIDNNWDMLFTDQDTKNQKGEYVPCKGYALKPNFDPENPKRFAQRTQVGDYFTRIGARYGAYSYVVSRSGMKKILDFIKKNRIFLPYDMEFYLPNDIRAYAVIDDIVSTEPQALSDNGAPNYLNKPALTTGE